MARRLTFAALMSVAAAAAAAAPFPDPTQPPGAGADGGAEATSSGPRLESVLISPQRTFAVISGRPVRVGDRVGEGRVVRIGPTEVAIRHGQDTQVLRLFPDYSRRPEAKTR